MSNFTSHKFIVLIHVSLPNGAHVIASISGSVALTPALVLHNVLYIPKFHVNLLSVAKLVQTNHCVVLFIDNSCQILQNHSKEMISTTKLHGGLYMLDASHHNHS